MAGGSMGGFFAGARAGVAERAELEAKLAKASRGGGGGDDLRLAYSDLVKQEADLNEAIAKMTPETRESVRAQLIRHNQTYGSAVAANLRMDDFDARYGYKEAFLSRVKQAASDVQSDAAKAAADGVTPAAAATGILPLSPGVLSRAGKQARGMVEAAEKQVASAAPWNTAGYGSEDAWKLSKTKGQVYSTANSFLTTYAKSAGAGDMVGLMRNAPAYSMAMASMQALLYESGASPEEIERVRADLDRRRDDIMAADKVDTESADKMMQYINEQVPRVERGLKLMFFGADADLPLADQVANMMAQGAANGVDMSITTAAAIKDQFATLLSVARDLIDSQAGPGGRKLSDVEILKQVESMYVNSPMLKFYRMVDPVASRNKYPGQMGEAQKSRAEALDSMPEAIQDYYRQSGVEQLGSFVGWDAISGVMIERLPDGTMIEVDERAARDFLATKANVDVYIQATEKARQEAMRSGFIPRAGVSVPTPQAPSVMDSLRIQQGPSVPGQMTPRAPAPVPPAAPTPIPAPAATKPFLSEGGVLSPRVANSSTPRRAADIVKRNRRAEW